MTSEGNKTISIILSALTVFNYMAVTITAALLLPWEDKITVLLQIAVIVPASALAVYASWHPQSRISRLQRKNKSLRFNKQSRKFELAPVKPLPYNTNIALTAFIIWSLSILLVLYCVGNIWADTRAAVVPITIVFSLAATTITFIAVIKSTLTKQ